MTELAMLVGLVVGGCLGFCAGLLFVRVMVTKAVNDG